MMTRILTISCMLLAAVTFAVITANTPVTVQSSAPQLINPGDEFMVRLRIDKGQLSKGAVLQQLLPAGFSATAIENENAQFYFENQKVRFVWDKLPNKNVLILAYKIKADVEVSGLSKLKGTFIYEENKNTAQIVLPENTIYVSNDYPVANAGPESANTGTLRVQRSIETNKGEQSNGYRITINVNNPNENGFATWTEHIPSSYSVEVNAASNGTYSREGSAIKFYWEQMPVENNWSFTYTIFPAQNGMPFENLEVYGMMIYGSDENIKTTVPGAGTVASFAPTELAATNTNQNSSSLVAEPTPEAEKTMSSEIVSDPVKEDVGKEVSTATAAKNNSMNMSVQRGIYYRVQIAATKRSPTRSPEFFESRFKITRPVDMAEEDGWKKYCIGTFARIEPAQTFATETRSHIPDAFVVAYREGKRIPVAEAMETLSISMR